MKRVAILGSTGSIGLNALEVIRRFPEEFCAVALSANANIGLLERQIREFRPFFVSVINHEAGKRLVAAVPGRTKVFSGEAGLLELVRQKDIDLVLVAIGGSAALLPLVAAIESGKSIALANKEAMVMAGPLLMEMAESRGAKIIPVDSEESAIWQCLQGQRGAKIKTIYLTASGGPLRKATSSQIKNISLKGVLAHPRWKMGKKITVDSATLMNKGLELLETMFFFGVGSDRIKIVIHPEAVIHSMVEFVDGAVIAQLSATDMRIPIQYALAYPKRLENSLPRVDFYKLGQLNFEKPDLKKFPCLRLALRAAGQLGTVPAVLSASDEVCVEAFLNKKIKFHSIPEAIERVMDRHKIIVRPKLEDVLKVDSWARQETAKIIEKSYL